MSRQENEQFVRNVFFEKAKRRFTQLIGQFVHDTKYVLEEAAAIFDRMLADMAYIDKTDHPMASSVFGSCATLAVYLALKKHGVDIVIAVDVTPQREMLLLPSKDTVLYEGNLFHRVLQFLKHLKSHYGTILLPRIIMRVIAIEGLEITRDKSRYFDIHIKPNLEDFDLFDFRKLPQIVAIGEQAGRREIAKIRDTIDALKR